MNLGKTTESPPVPNQKLNSINPSSDLCFELRLKKLSNSNDKNNCEAHLFDEAEELISSPNFDFSAHDNIADRGHQQKLQQFRDFIDRADSQKIAVGHKNNYQFQGQISCVSNATRVSSSDINVSPFRNELREVAEDIQNETDFNNILGAQSDKQVGNNKDDGQEVPFNNQRFKKLLFVETLASQRKPRLTLSSTQQMIFNQLAAVPQEKRSKFEMMEKRISNFLDGEGVHLQHVGEYLHEKNNQAFKGMAKLSPLKLDLTKSPLRRHRANTICL